MSDQRSCSVWFPLSFLSQLWFERAYCRNVRKNQSAIQILVRGWPHWVVLCFHLLCLPQHQPVYFILGTNGIGPYIYWTAQNLIIRDRHYYQCNTYPLLTCLGIVAKSYWNCVTVVLPLWCPRTPPFFEISRKQRMVSGLYHLCRFSTKLQLSWMAFVAVLFLRRI